MFSITNLTNKDAGFLKQKIVPGISGSKTVSAAYYQLQAPFGLQLTTYHPDNSEQRLLFTSISPDNIIYSSSSAAEVEQYLSGSLHQHDFYELLFVIEGSLYQNIENSRHLYIPGSCCLLNKNVRHKEEYSTDFRVIFFQFSELFLQQVFTALSLNYFRIEREHQKTEMQQFLQQNIFLTGSMEKNYIDFIPTLDASWIVQNVHSIFEQITLELLSPQFGSSALIMSLFFRLFHLLDQPEYYQTSPVKIGTAAENRIFHEITRQMEGTNGRSSRSDFESLFHYSGDYLNKIVKKYAGLTIFDYGMTFCMKKAASLLLHTAMTISEISLYLGFSNRTHFYKIFQNTYNMTPTEYRKACRTIS